MLLGEIMSKKMLVKNIGRLVTMDEYGDGEGLLGVIENAFVYCEDGIIKSFGKMSSMYGKYDVVDVFDAKGSVVLPGLIDCHTHLVHAGYRQNEYDKRSRGIGYAEIARLSGGGIMSTVRSTCDASEDDLFISALERVKEAVSLGVTTLEVKTGYGLSRDCELKMARVIDRLADAGRVNVFGTYLAHVVPSEYASRRGEYVDEILENILPDIAAMPNISAADIFVENIAFTREEAERIACAARGFGLETHLHVDQFEDGGGAALAARVGALSADHLDCASPNGLEAMAESGTVAVVLPGATFFTSGGLRPDVTVMRESGVKIAVATDYNPGTSPNLDPILNATIAVSLLGMTCDEALIGITKNATAALGLSDRGIIKPNMRADLVVFDAPDEYYPLYRYGKNCVRAVINGGKLIFDSFG